MISIDYLIGYLTAARDRGCTKVAIDASLIADPTWDRSCDLPAVERVEVIDDAEKPDGGYVVLVPEDCTE